MKPCSEDLGGKEEFQERAKLKEARFRSGGTHWNMPPDHRKRGGAWEGGSVIRAYAQGLLGSPLKIEDHGKNSGHAKKKTLGGELNRPLHLV